MFINVNEQISNYTLKKLTSQYIIVVSRIRKGFPYEARVITRVLPTFLADFFPPQDIMNKVIGEFLSNQQPHPQLMATVLFQVCYSTVQKAS